MSSEPLLLGLAGVLAFGVLAQWIAVQWRLPSIVLLLSFGFIAGPIWRWWQGEALVDPDALFGDTLFPFVSLSVGVILFEGGLSLRFRELRTVGRSVQGLITMGMLVTWIGLSAAAWWFLGLNAGVAVLLGAVLVVTGPTVIIPLLRHVRPNPQVSRVLKWEGILIDPVGALLAVLVFEVLTTADVGEAAGLALGGVLKTVVGATLVGVAGGLLLWVVLARHWVPERLHNPVALFLVVIAFVVSDLIQAESGLWAATIMGIVLANQRTVDIRHIVEFKETLGLLLVSVLFILLGARLRLEQIALLDVRILLFLAVAILLVRPLATLISTRGSELSWRERAFVAWMAPRGIVAASVASVFAFGLDEAGFAGGDILVPVTFATIFGTVVIYGLTATPVARLLGIGDPEPQGILFVGGHQWARELAETLKDQDISVLIADLNPRNVAQARERGLDAFQGNVLTEEALDELETSGLGRLIALTRNDEVNTLACMHFAPMFGRMDVYQLAPRGRAEETDVSQRLRGRILFDLALDFDTVQARYHAGARFKVTAITEAFGPADYAAQHGDRATPLFLVREGGLHIIAAEEGAELGVGDRVVALVDPAPGEEPVRPVEDDVGVPPPSPSGVGEGDDPEARHDGADAET